MDKDIAEDRSPIYDTLLKEILNIDQKCATMRMNQLSLWISRNILPDFDKAAIRPVPYRNSK